MEATSSIVAQVPDAPLASDQADTTQSTEPEAADPTGSTDGQAAAEAPDQAVELEAPSPEADDALAALGMPLDPETADAGADDDIADGAPTADTASVPENAVDNATPPEVAVAAPVAPAQPAASHKSNAATTHVAAILAATPPAPPPPPAPIASDEAEAATNTVATVLAATAPAPAPPLPKRKPVEKQPEPKVAAFVTPQAAPARQDTAKQDTAKQDLAQQGAAQPHSGSGPWQPMALAPADKPSISLSKAPINKPSGGAYASQVWAALARHKPRAGQRGSTTVAFSIGENGALRGVRVGRSSGNTRIDQLALATVRNAAPFPPPPAGAASYSIRIDFQ
jgi:protein TonB